MHDFSSHVVSELQAPIRETAAIGLIGQPEAAQFCDIGPFQVPIEEVEALALDMRRIYHFAILRRKFRVRVLDGDRCLLRSCQFSKGATIVPDSSAGKGEGQ